ncbi:MAG: SLC26A/SulP transporter family protein [Chloroflexi bacterium]|nr:SLC26A/SulP transporter family protein [Chloroflexota bacterium]
MITASVEISFAVLIFSGDLAGFVSNGIGLFLAGTLIATIVTGLTSSYPGTVSINQDVPAAIVAVVAAGIAGSMSASATPDEMYLTVVAAIIVTSLLTGLVFMFQGYFKLGALFRFLPYPVVGGFLAGTGWLLARGGLTVMTGISPEFGQLPALFQQDVWLRWLPGVIFAVAMLLILNRFGHYLIMPGMILGAVGLFYLVILLLNVPIDQVSDQGWLLGPFPEGGLWQPFSPTALFKVQWSAIFEQAGNIAAILIVSTIALLLNASGLELTVKQDIQLDRELQVNGLGTLGSGLVGGLVSYSALSLSILGYRIGSSSRLLGLVVAAVLGVVLYFGPNVLSWTPKMIFGSLLMFLGLSLLDEWVYKAWFRFSRIDFLIIISILVVIATIGFLQGVALGVVLAVVLFVVNYSRVNVVKHSLSGTNYQSRVTRRRVHRQILEQKGDEIYILQLQGFIFFGTANKLLNQVRQRVEATDLPQLRFAVFDFRQVTGLDSTARLSFTKMKQLAQTQQIVLVFTNPSLESVLPNQNNSISKLFAQLDDVEQGETEKTVHIFPDLDRGLEWCENQILLAAGANLNDAQENLQTQLGFLLPEATNLDGLLKYFERLDVGSGYYLMKQGDPPEDLYFIESGQVTAQLEFPDRNPVRLETMRGGRVVGEIGFYLNKPRTAAVATDEPSTIYRLSKQALKQMEQNDPEVASAFHHGIIRLVSERLTHLINTVNALQR